MPNSLKKFATPMKHTSREVLEFLPDSAQWVEARGMLISGRGFVLDFQQEPEPRGAIFQEDIGLAVVIGIPDEELIFQISEIADELICPLGSEKAIAHVLPHWSREFGSFMQLAEPIDLNDWARNNLVDKKMEPLGFRQLDSKDLAKIKNVPGSLLEEFEQELAVGTEIFCLTVEGNPVSFCFAAAKSESLWDISIDTLESYRRQGHAENCVRLTISQMLEKGFSPVWGVVDSNTASKRLAEKLGFEESMRLAVFTRDN